MLFGKKQRGNFNNDSTINIDPPAESHGARISLLCDIAQQFGHNVKMDDKLFKKRHLSVLIQFKYCADKDKQRQLIHD